MGNRRVQSTLVPLPWPLRGISSSLQGVWQASSPIYWLSSVHLVVDSQVPVSRVYHAAALLPKEAALVRSFAARLQQNLGFLGLQITGNKRKFDNMTNEYLEIASQMYVDIPIH